MFEQFQWAVRNAYLALKNNKELPFDREWPSPGELKKWCLMAYSKGLSKDDAVIFSRFFNHNKTNDDMSTAISNLDVDKLRPLRNFIIGETNRRPDENLVKLLAVLIDFRPRPYTPQDWFVNQSPQSKNMNIAENKSLPIQEEKVLYQKEKVLYEEKKAPSYIVKQVTVNNHIQVNPYHTENTKVTYIIKKKTPITKPTFAATYKIHILLATTMIAIALLFGTYIKNQDNTPVGTMVIILKSTITINLNLQKLSLLILKNDLTDKNKPSGYTCNIPLQ